MREMRAAYFLHFLHFYYFHFFDTNKKTAVGGERRSHEQAASGAPLADASSKLHPVRVAPNTARRRHEHQG